MASVLVITDQPQCQCTGEAQSHIARPTLTSYSTSTKVTSSHNTHQPASSRFHQKLLPHQGRHQLHPQTVMPSSMATPLLPQLQQVMTLMLFGAAKVLLWSHNLRRLKLMAALAHLKVIQGQQAPPMPLQQMHLHDTLMGCQLTAPASVRLSLPQAHALSLPHQDRPDQSS